MKRRDFLRKSMVGLGGAALAPGLAAAEDGEKTFDPVETVALGDTGIEVSLVGFGTGYRGSNRSSAQTRLGRDTFQSLLQFAYRRGINFFDAADLYGSHPYIARTMSEVPREDYTLVSKLWFRDGGLPTEKRPGAQQVVKRFLQELETDYIDIVQLHCVTREDWPTQLSDRMQGLDKLKKQGAIRAHGVSSHSLEGLKTAADEDWVDCVHARINPFGAKMSKSPEKTIPVLRDIHEGGKGVIGMKICGGGEFADDSGKVQQSVRLALSLDCVDAIIVGFLNRDEMRNMTDRVARVPRSAAPADVMSTA